MAAATHPQYAGAVKRRSASARPRDPHVSERGFLEVGSGDVFTDLGYADAKERRLKLELAMEVNRVLKQRGPTRARAAKTLGVRQPHVSDLARYRLNRFSVERLMEFLTLLGKDVEIRITQRPARRSSSSVRVHHVA